MKNEETFHTELIEAIDGCPLSDTALSLKVSSSPKLISRLRDGMWPSGRILIRLCAEIGIFLGQNASSKTAHEAEAKLPFIGNIAAGGSDGYGEGRVTTYAENSDKTVSAPIGVSEQDIQKHGGLAALRVKGASMKWSYNFGQFVKMYSLCQQTGYDNE